MPWYIDHIRALMTRMNLDDEEILIRMTGCPNGCARPYMAELAFVGDGANSYQLWLGGSPVLAERTASPHMSKMDTNALETTLEPILAFFIEKRDKFESFGDFCYRVGSEAIDAYSKSYTLGSVKA